ncbi:MAG: FkbM family methyltransferase [Solirubrobacteraceae bacterium]
MAPTPLKRFVRGVVEPADGAVRRIPLGPGSGIKLEADPEPSLDQWLGLFESELAPYVRRFCRPGTMCVDVGSYNAYYALIFAKRSGAPVRSYEPDAHALARSRRNVALNADLAGLVDIREAFVGAAADPANSVVTLDDELAEWGPPGLIKIDVEGAELGVLTGAAHVLRHHRPHVIVETHSPGLEIACGDCLVGVGYAPTVVTQRRLLPQDRPRQHNRWLVAAGRAGV